ncbi:MAG: lipid II:glycine glycyltransferase FemX [Sphaerochaetaceae bacterium]
MGAVSVRVAGFSELDSSLNPFQSSFWAAIKQHSGWNPLAFRVSVNQENSQQGWTTTMLVLTRRLVMGYFLSYVPFAPATEGLPMVLPVFIKELSRELKPLLPKGTICIRYDLPWGKPDDEDPTPLVGFPLRTCKESVQPEGTSRIDLSGGFETVRMQYRERANRNIRKAINKNVTISEWDHIGSSFESWYSVYQETARRDGFMARSSEYLHRFLDCAHYSYPDPSLDYGVRKIDPHSKVYGEYPPTGGGSQDIECHLYLAWFEKKIVGGAMVLSSKEVAVYLFGASLRLDGISCSYLLQDYAIEQACRQGKKIYDLYGISGPHNRGAHLEGLHLFKRSFGGCNYYRQPSTDYVFHPLIHYLYAFTENLRYAIHRHRQPRRISQQFSVSREQ